VFSGTATAPSGSRPIDASLRQDDPPWDLAAELAVLKPVTSFTLSEHGRGELEGRILVRGATTRAANRAHLGAFEVGTIVVEEHRAPGEPSVSMLLAMRKRTPGYNPAGGDWEYGVADPSGAFSQRGALFACGRCHAEARHDSVFSGIRWSP
jgi:hypothetical protein